MKNFTLLFFALGLFIPSASQKFKAYIVKIEEGRVQEGKKLLNSLKDDDHITDWKYLDTVKDAITTANQVAVTNLTASAAVNSVELDTDMSLPDNPDGGGQGRIRRRNRNLDDTLQVVSVTPESVGYTPHPIEATKAADIPELPSETKKICIVDSGYDTGNSHIPTLEKGDGLDSTNGYTSYESKLWSEDVNGHGTRTASLLVGTGQNETLIKGIMNQNSDSNFTNFVIAKAVQDNGTSTASHVIDAMNSCAERDADVIILSVTSKTYSQAFADAVKVLFEEKDCLLLAPTGGQRDTDQPLLFPAFYEHVISVGAIDDNRTPKYTLPNTQNEIMAFGVRLGTGNTFGDEEFLSGTSVAVTLVAGSAALIWSHFPDCSPMQVRYALARTAHREFPYGNGDCTIEKGHGVVNAKDAYDFLTAHTCTGAGSTDKWNIKYRNKSIVESGNCFGTVSQTSPPTDAPTDAPTNAPTDAPTDKRTYARTHAPTSTLPPCVDIEGSWENAWGAEVNCFWVISENLCAEYGAAWCPVSCNMCFE